MEKRVPKSVPGDGARFDEEAIFLRCVALDGGEEARRLSRLLAKMLCKAAAKNGWAIESLDEECLSLRASGRGCRDLANEAGLHRFVTSSGKSGKRHTNFCKIEAELPTKAEAIEVRECDVEFKSQKAGGPGGQHVNKTESAVRATHRPSGLSVLCASERSQAENKRIAVQWLGAKLARIELEGAARSRREAWASRARLGAGEPLRLYWIEEDRVQDHASGRRGRAGDVLSGGCEEMWAPKG